MEDNESPENVKDIFKQREEEDIKYEALSSGMSVEEVKLRREIRQFSREKIGIKAGIKNAERRLQRMNEEIRGGLFVSMHEEKEVKKDIEWNKQRLEDIEEHINKLHEQLSRFERERESTGKIEPLRKESMTPLSEKEPNSGVVDKENEQQALQQIEAMEQVVNEFWELVNELAALPLDKEERLKELERIFQRHDPQGLQRFLSPMRQDLQQTVRAMRESFEAK